MVDNCTLTFNPDQHDSDRDGIGNDFDADLNNDGMVTLSDFRLFVSVIFTNIPGLEAYVLADHAVLNNNAFVDMAEYSIFRRSFGAAADPSCCSVTVQ